MSFNSSINGYPLNQTPGTGPITQVFGRYGPNIVAQAGDYNASMVGADPSGTAASAIVSHTSLLDPHTQYQKEAELETFIDNALLEYDNTINVLAGTNELRRNVSIATNVITAGDIEVGMVYIANSFELRKIQVDSACRIRLYMTVADRNADLSRPFITTPPVNSGVILDYQFTDVFQNIRFDFPILGYDDEINPDGYIAYAITNQDVIDRDINITISILRTE